MIKPKVGEKLYRVYNDQRWHKNDYVVVEKVGREYFYAGHDRYQISDWVQNDGQFSNNSRLWQSKELYEQYAEASDYNNGLYKLLPKLTPQQTIEIYNIVKNMIENG